MGSCMADPKNTKNNLKNENEKFSFMKEKEIIELEKKEENLIKRLEKSQKIDDNILEKMEEIAFTPVEEFIQKYGEKEKEIKNVTLKNDFHTLMLELHPSDHLFT